MKITPADAALAEGFAGEMDSDADLGQPSGKAANAARPDAGLVRRGSYGDGTPWMGTWEEVAGDYKQAAQVEARIADELRAELASLRASRDALVRALEDAELSLHGAWQMLAAINDADPSTDRLKVARRTAVGLSNARIALAAAKEQQ